METNNTEEALGEVVDLFCGIGGISHGFRRVGFDIRAGYDMDESCRYAYETNNAARFVVADMAEVTASNIKSRFSGQKPTVLVGCAPCQPFSGYKKGKTDARWNLLKRFAQLAIDVDADFVTMENVSGLLEYQSGELFREFMTTLSKAYNCTAEVVNCSNYGVPQSRRRLVVIGTKNNALRLPKMGHGAARSVKDAIAHLPPIQAGEVCRNDELHRSSKLQDINLKRIQSSKPGGSWKDWPDDLVATCHKSESGKGYRSVYGRMEWEKPAPTMTTQCYGFGNGRFGHPDQDRAISLREAAILQSFPESYEFFPQNRFPGFKTTGRWIGNAVPVALAESIAIEISKEILTCA